MFVTPCLRRAAEYIQYFIKLKIRDDLSWQRINIVFSGAEARPSHDLPCVFGRAVIEPGRLGARRGRAQDRSLHQGDEVQAGLQLPDQVRLSPVFIGYTACTAKSAHRLTSRTLSHCVYGLDADLIMLGLATQERHMSIIREKIMLGHGRRGDDAPPVQFFATRDFEFLHVSLLRDYLAVDLGAPNT